MCNTLIVRYVHTLCIQPCSKYIVFMYLDFY